MHKRVLTRVRHVVNGRRRVIATRMFIGCDQIVKSHAVHADVQLLLLPVALSQSIQHAHQLLVKHQQQGLAHQTPAHQTPVHQTPVHLVQHQLVHVPTQVHNVVNGQLLAIAILIHSS